VQQAAAQLPWMHLCALLDKLKDSSAREWYLAKAVEHGWSRSVLVMQIEAQAMQRAGSAVTNFSTQLPKPQSDLARETLKDPYRFDFLGLADEAQEREIENALVGQLSKFLLELGAGFAFVGRQVHIEVGGEDFYLDLLFYHLKLRCYVVVELKAGAFKPEHAGQLNFYLSAVDAQVKTDHDAPTIGLLLCKTKNRVVAEYALRGASKPMGVAELPTRSRAAEEAGDGAAEHRAHRARARTHAHQVLTSRYTHGRHDRTAASVRTVRRIGQSLVGCSIERGGCRSGTAVPAAERAQDQAFSAWQTCRWTPSLH
jgi:predicted nuclease of restriction endonuclease-like (RecB) superfamily